jgi:arylsulfatase A-like enzyme
MDRSIGNLRRKLRSLGIADNTILWFNSDNGGVKPFAPAVNGGLRGFKSELYEGGIRVPCIIEWPNVIRQPRSSDLPASVLDILPTLAEVAGIEKSLPDRPLDGMSLMGLLQGKMKERVTPIPFRYQQKAAWVDYPYKLVSNKYKEGGFELYHLKNDPNETTDLSEREPAVAKRMTEAFFKWSASVEKSIAGKDYPEGLTAPDEPSKPWMSAPAYRPWLEVLMKRPEYKAVKVEED